MFTAHDTSNQYEAFQPDPEHIRARPFWAAFP